MIREAVQSDLDAILELYLFLHEDRVPEKDEHLRETWMQIIQDPNHHLIVNVVDDKIVSSCVCVIIPRITEGKAAPESAWNMPGRSLKKKTVIR